jgi:hypothetical protein
VKTIFGFDELAEAIDDERKGKRAYDKLCYMMWFESRGKHGHLTRRRVMCEMAHM